MRLPCGHRRKRIWAEASVGGGYCILKTTRLNWRIHEHRSFKSFRFFSMALLEDASAVWHRTLCPATLARPCPFRLHGFLGSSGSAVCDSGHTIGTAPVLSGRPAGRVAGATPLERSCRILAQRVMGRNRGGDSVCRTTQPCRRIARPTYGGYRCSRSVSAPGRNPAVDPAILAASSKSDWTGGVISVRTRIDGCVHQRKPVAKQYWSSIYNPPLCRILPHIPLLATQP